jgi:glycosyltransferase involved in cell wall biosynthesis
MESTQEKKKLLFVGLPPTAFFSGQGRVARALTLRFNEVFDVRVAGWGCDEREVKNFPLFIYPNSEKWWDIILEWKPDILFLSHDCWRFPQLVQIKRQFPNLKIVGYFTIDGDPISKSWFPIFDACDIILVPSQWGKDVILERYSSRPVFVIPQGVELSFFFHQVDKFKVKQEVDRKTNENVVVQHNKLLLQDKFIISFSGMNQTKKNIGALLDGFQEFSKNKETFLFLVTHSYVANIFGAEVLSDYDFSDSFSWKKASSKFKIVDRRLSENDLLNIYLASDLLLCPSIGEGFGLFVLEAMATGTIPMISYYSAFTELPAKDSCFFLQPAAFHRNSWNIKRAIISAEEVAKKLEIAYNMWLNVPSAWTAMQERNWLKVKDYSWDACAINILKLLLDLDKGTDFFDVEVRKL